MLINKSAFYHKKHNNLIETILEVYRTKIARGFAIILSTVVFALLGKVISLAGMYILGDGFAEIFEPLAYIGLTTGFVIGLIYDLDEFYTQVFKITYYVTIGAINVGLGILLGWAIMYFLA